MGSLILRIAFLLFITIHSTDAVSLKKRKPCINGDQDGDKCFCYDGWTGALCHRKMNCEGYERQNNGSCMECQLGWRGPDCDAIFCHDHGKANYDETACTCDKPYSGVYCETFQTKDVYSYYNNFASRTGALGVLCVIPLCIIYMTCEKCAHRRQLERVGQQLSGTILRNNENKAVDPKAVSLLLAEPEDDDSD